MALLWVLVTLGWACLVVNYPYVTVLVTSGIIILGWSYGIGVIDRRHRLWTT